MNSILEKLGFSQFDNDANKKMLSFDDVTDLNLKSELKLIQQIQVKKDPFAEGQLIARYRGALNDLVNKSPAKKTVGYDIAYQHAVSELKRSIKVYDLKQYLKVKPITFIFTNVNLELKKLYDKSTSQSGVKMADDLSRGKTLLNNASSILVPKLGRKPTNQELLNFIKNDMGYGKSLTLDKINKIQKYDTKELSSSRTIGKGNADGAETLTFEDVMHTTQDVGLAMKKEEREEEVINAIRKYTTDKSVRRFLIAYLGLGEFKNAGIKTSINKCAIRSGISYYDGRKHIEAFRNFCKTNGVM